MLKLSLLKFTQIKHNQKKMLLNITIPECLNELMLLFFLNILKSGLQT